MRDLATFIIGYLLGSIARDILQAIVKKKEPEEFIDDRFGESDESGRKSWLHTLNQRKI